MDALRRDLRFAIRGLLRERTFALTALLTLMLGIGANTAIFTLVNALLLRSLPYPDGDRLVHIASTVIRPDNLAEWRAGLSSLDRTAAYGLGSAVRTGAGPATQSTVMLASPELLSLLGARAAQGRLWSEQDFAANASPVALVSARMWNTLAPAGRSAARSVVLNGVNYAVVGALPSSAFLYFRDIDFWVPATQFPTRSLTLIGRVAAGSTLEQVRTQATAVGERFQAEGSLRDVRRIVNPQWLRNVLVGDLRSPLLVLLGASVLVLLIACANVANLLLSRTGTRLRELSVRAALGAGRGMLLRQLLTESALLAVAGATGGLLLAWWAVHATTALAAGTIRGLEDVHLDPAVLGFTLLVASLTTVLGGLAPALAGSRPAHATGAALRVTATRASRRWRELLVSGEVALALVLLIATVLLARTFLILRPANPGFDTRDRLIATLALPTTSAQVTNTEFWQGLLQRIQAAPGRPRAALVTDLPLSGSSMFVRVTGIDGRAPDAPPERPLSIHFRSASPDYFDVMDMRLLRGRNLREAEGPNGPLSLVINENAAHRLWPDGADPLGHHVSIDIDGTARDFTVVGISADVRFMGGITDARAEVFASFWQLPWARTQLVVHDATRTLTADGLRQIVASVDPDLPLRNLSTMTELASQSVAFPRFQMTLMSIYGVLALVLALVGCYGVLAYQVTQRTREFGVRAALGASRFAILSQVVRRALLLLGVGLAGGLLLARAGSSLIASLLYGVTPSDPLTFVLATAALALAILGAALLPAWRAASITPLEALRAE